MPPRSGCRRPGRRRARQQAIRPLPFECARHRRRPNDSRSADCGRCSSRDPPAFARTLRCADPHRILLLTFSRRAALDMTSRVRRITGAAMGTGHIDLSWAGTFHAVGARILREYAPRIGLKPSFTILDRSDAADLIDVVRHDLGLSKKESRFPRKDTCLAIYSFAINSGATIKATLRDQFPWCIEWDAHLRRLFREYMVAKQRQNVLDYDDLLLCWAEMMNDADLAAELGDRFDHVLVDEFQDTNRLQAKILSKLKPDGRGVTVVGDDAQAIYSFRAATVRNILDFPDHFDPSARIITPEQNYRSTSRSSTPVKLSLAWQRTDLQRTCDQTGNQNSGHSSPP